MGETLRTTSAFNSMAGEHIYSIHQICVQLLKKWHLGIDAPWRQRAEFS